MVLNGGEPNEAFMIDQDTNFPNYDLAVNLPLFPGSFYLDVNKDGLKDLLISPNGVNISENKNSCLYYKNISNQSNELFWSENGDNMIQFDKWMNWTEIVNRVPIGILARPDNTLAPLKSKMAKTFYSYRLKANQSRKLGNLKAPSWCYKNLPLLNVSSSQIRVS